MKTNTFKHSHKIQQPQLGTVAYWSICSFAGMINSDRNPEGTTRVRRGVSV